MGKKETVETQFKRNKLILYSFFFILSKTQSLDGFWFKGKLV